MKRENILWLGIAMLVMSLISASCVKQGCVEDVEFTINQSSTKQAYQKKLSRDIMELSESDAIKLAGLFSETARTKSVVRPVKEVIPIIDNCGKTVMYAVNYNDGYTIVSATRKYHPVLADVEHGTFSFENQTGAQILINEMIEDIEKIDLGKSEAVSTSEWERYLEDETYEIPKTKMPNDDYFDVLDRYLEIWSETGERMYYLRNKPEDMPEEMYQSFCSMAETDMGELDGYPYMECAIITEKHNYQYENKGPLLATHWNQDSRYSPQYGTNLGCVTIAVGQIMKYYEYPQYFNWSQMPDTVLSGGNSVLTSFLELLHDDLNVNNSGGAYDSRALKVLKNYGYNCQKVSHTKSYPYSLLKDGHPVYMSGMKADDITKGHAWVCDGYYSSSHSVKYTLYILTFSQGKPNALEEWFDNTVYLSGPTIFFHMNWGWGGEHDGYFLDNNITVDGKNYSKFRNDIIISGHN